MPSTTALTLSKRDVPWHSSRLSITYKQPSRICRVPPRKFELNDKLSNKWPRTAPLPFKSKMAFACLAGPYGVGRRAKTLQPSLPPATSCLPCTASVVSHELNHHAFPTVFVVHRLHKLEQDSGYHAMRVAVMLSPPAFALQAPLHLVQALRL
jgi:hypothetical protein